MGPWVVNQQLDVIYQTRDTVFNHISNTKKRVENMMRSTVFLTIFEVFDIVMNTMMSVLYNFSNELILKGKLRKNEEFFIR